MKNTLSLIIVFIAAIFISACETGPTDTVVTIKTEYGEMVAILYDETPKHKANFIKLAREHFYDGTLFHRVVKDFMIQGGDPQSKTVKPGERLGNGGPGYTLPAEISPKYFHERGSLSAARQNDDVNPKRESSGSQFYIVQGRIYSPNELESMKYDDAVLDAGLRRMYADPKNKPLFDSLKALRAAGDDDAYLAKIYSLAPRVEQVTGLKATREFSEAQIKAYTTVGGAAHLDNAYTVFGKVVQGLNIIDKIASIPTDEAERPIKDIQVTITVEDVPKSKITRLYGYHYPDEK